MKPGTAILTTVFVLCCYEISAQTPLDSLKDTFESQIGETIGEFDRYGRQALEEYKEYTLRAARDHAAYLSDIQQVWGEDNILEDTPVKWVEYGEDFMSRSIVDFDSGEIIVEVMLADGRGDKGHEGQPDEEKLLEDAVSRLLSSRGSTCPYKSSADISEPLTDNPILEGLVDFSGFDIPSSGEGGTNGLQSGRKTPPLPAVKGKKLPGKDNAPPTLSDTLKNGKEQTMASQAIKDDMADRTATDNATVAEAVARQSKKTYKTYGKGTKAKRAVQITLSLVTDNLSKNAALYKDIVSEFSQKFQIEQALIYAVMEQESRFNPEATSHVPAYGLMQLVPESGGFDAYRYVYGKEWVPTRSYLFNPRNNIELGTAYLRILENQFSNIENPHCRRLCVIAGYNTGAGNVSRAFTGNTNLNKALPLINGYGYNQLYNHLTTKLGTEEARNYVSGVTQRREKYLQ